jgi:hypothetical protein
MMTKTSRRSGSARFCDCLSTVVDGAPRAQPADGSNFADDKGNATLFVGYRNIDDLLQSERSYSACALGSLPPPQLRWLVAASPYAYPPA